MKTAFGRLRSTPIVVLGLICSSGVPALAEKGSPGTDIQQLANRVRKVIKLVEDNPTITCDMRNHLVKRLRSLDDALESGNRSEARALVMAWTGEARSYQRAGLLSAAHGAILHNGLQGFIEEIGTGWPAKPGPTRKWAPLPACDSGQTPVPAASLAAAAAENPCLPPVPEGGWDSNDTLTVLQTMLGQLPEVGGVLSGLLGILWPSNGADVSALIDRKIDQATICYTIVPALNGLKAALQEGFIPNREAWKADCDFYGPNSDQCKGAAWTNYNQWYALFSEGFLANRNGFQTGSEDYQLTLLPYFAQYQTLYMSFLREGILLAPLWMAGGVGENLAGAPAKIIKEELDPSFVDPLSNIKDPVTGAARPDRGIAYVNSIYQRGLDAQPQPTGNHKFKVWTERNAFIRDMTLKVLDFRDTWKFMDATVYPEGVAGGVKLTRMIYSDPVGHMFDPDFDSFHPPANVSGPLKELTVWSQKHNLEFNGGEWLTSAIQSTNPPTVGPARSGEITGDATHDGTTGASYMDLRVIGPITKVHTDTGFRGLYEYQLIPARIDFKLAADDWIHTASYGNQIEQTWSYPGHVLATAKAMGIYNFGGGTSGTQSVIFGFRFYDSFFPSGALVSVASGSCMNVASVTSGAQPNVASCSGLPGQIWTYDTGTHVITIGDPGLCLRAAGGSAVVIGACTGAKNEQWELVPSPTGLSGMVKSVAYEMVLTVANPGTAISLSAASGPNGSASQQWKATSPLQGEVHGVGSGRCLNVIGPGSVAQIWDCNGTAGQTWTYDESERTLSVYNGTQCLKPAGNAIGSPLMIGDCLPATSLQKWVFNRDRTITNVATGYVVDVLGGSVMNTALVGLASLASPVTASQQWSRPSRLGGNVHATYAGKCLDVPTLADGTQAQIYGCLASPAPGQEWTYHPLTQRITAHGDGTEHCLSIAGMAVVVTACADDANQLWSLRDNGIGGTIVSTPSLHTPPSPLCMTIAGTEQGAKVVVQACPASDQPANPNQQWIWP